MKTLLKIALASLLTFAGCSTTQMAAYNAEKAKVAATLGTPQAQMIEKAAESIAQVAVTVAAPELAWTIPLAVQAASGYLNGASPADTVRTAITTISGVPAYHNVATQASAVINAVAPQTEAQQVAAVQFLADAISQALAKQKK